MNVAIASANSAGVWASDEAWQQKLMEDALAITGLLPSSLVRLHEVVVERAHSSSAHGLILSGSTARGARTEISDLDYHLVGSELHTADLSLELDIHALSPKKLRTEILLGDDFVQWSLRFGRIVFDDGTARSALQLIDQRQLWPNSERKRVHAAKSLALAKRFVATGDADGALDQVRAALSLAARAHLLRVGVFPLSRSELPSQLRMVGHEDAGLVLQETIRETPPLSALERAVAVGEGLI